jgi:hypothetical protein
MCGDQIINVFSIVFSMAYGQLTPTMWAMFWDSCSGMLVSASAAYSYGGPNCPHRVGTVWGQFKSLRLSYLGGVQVGEVTPKEPGNSIIPMNSQFLKMRRVAKTRFYPMPEGHPGVGPAVGAFTRTLGAFWRTNS